MHSKSDTYENKVTRAQEKKEIKESR